MSEVPKLPKGKGLKLRTFWLIIYLAIIVLAGGILLPTYWYLWLIIVAIALFRIAFYYLPPRRYRCSNCGNVFSPGPKRLQARPSPSQIYEDRSKIRCPKCGSTAVVRIKGKET